MAISWSKCPVPGRLRGFWGEIPPLFGGPGRDKTARSAGSVPELSNTTVGGWQTPCSGDPDRTASPCRRSRFQNSPVRSATVVTATDLAQGNLKAERGRPAISSLVGDRHGHMDCRKMLSGPPDSAGQKWDVAARGTDRPPIPHAACSSSRLKGGFLVNAFCSWEAEKIICLFEGA